MQLNGFNLTILLFSFLSFTISLYGAWLQSRAFIMVLEKKVKKDSTEKRLNRSGEGLATNYTAVDG